MSKKGQFKKDIYYISKHIEEKKLKIITRKKLDFKNKRIIFELVLIINIIIQIFSKSKTLDGKLEFSKITLKIKGKGNQNILYKKETSFIDELPNLVYINGNLQNKVSYSYKFKQTDNFVEFVWNENIKNCDFMFFQCSNITEIDLSNFNTSEITDMSYMFNGCKSLISLNISNIDTSRVKNMEMMFLGCSSLISLDLSNFDTSLVTNMYCMFEKCSSLVTLNLSKFNNSQVTNIYYMFNGCINLQFISLGDFNDSILSSYTFMFKNIQDNVVICINKDNPNNIKVVNQIHNIACSIIDCSDNWMLKQKKIIDIDNSCVDSCSTNINYKYEYNGKCYNTCKNGYIISNNNFPTNKCKCELEKCLSCPQVALSNDLCEKCNTNFYPLENDPSNLGIYINCYNNVRGHYLDTNEYIFKKCYYRCETCEMKGNNTNHNCLECKAIYDIKINKNNYINCYNHDDKYNSDYIDIKGYISQELEISEKIDNKNESKTNYYDAILENYEYNFTHNYNTSKLDNEEDEINRIDKITITLTTTKNQKNNINNSMTTINLEECELLLRAHYNISGEQLLYMKKIDVIQDQMKIPKIEFDLYSKLNGTDLIKLNLSICKESKIFLIVPIDLDENIDILNSSSEYYSDICYKSKSESGTDILLNDRKKEFIEGNKTICQEDYIFYDYLQEISKENCSCKVKESSSKFDNLNINKTKLYENFGETKNKKVISNLGLTSCNELSSKENIESNTGFYLLLFILIGFIIIFIIFYIKGYNLLENTIDNVIYKKFKNELKAEKLNKKLNIQEAKKTIK